MSFATNFARAMAPIAVAAIVAAPAVAQSADIKAVQASLAATNTLTANFVQTDRKGRSLRGELALKRPGKIRFAYGDGVNALMVGDGKTLHYLDYEVNQHSKWSINNTPLAILLSPNPEIGRIARIEKSENPQVVVVRARDARRPEFGTLYLAFTRNAGAPGGLKLEGWTAVDAQNKRTVVRLSNQRFNVAVPDTSFNFAPVKKKA